nr:hypothetical protein [uncultured Sphingobacterium sp.]
MNKEELIRNLPTNWSQISLSQYINLIKDLPTEKLEGETDNRFQAKILSVFFYHFTGVHLHDAELSATEMMQVIQRINQFNEHPDDVNIDKYILKDIDKIDYNTFITLVKYLEMGDVSYYPAMLNLLLVTPVEDIDNLNMAAAYYLIKALKKKLMMYLDTSQASLKEKIRLLREKEQLQKTTG